MVMTNPFIIYVSVAFYSWIYIFYFILASIKNYFILTTTTKDQALEMLLMWKYYNVFS